MSTLLTALQKAETERQPRPAVPLNLLEAAPSKKRPLYYWLLPPLGLLLGVAANYGWHNYHARQKPLEERVEVVKTIASPFQPLEPLANELLLPLPPPLPAPPQVEPKPKVAGYDLSGVSPDLARSFAEAINDPSLEIDNLINQNVDGAPIQPQSTAASNNVPALSYLDPKLKSLIPAFTYNAHNYSSDPSRRFVVLGGRELRVGNEIAPKVTLKVIEQESVLIEVNGVVGLLKALQDWQP